MVGKHTSHELHLPKHLRQTVILTSIKLISLCLLLQLGLGFNLNPKGFSSSDLSSI